MLARHRFPVGSLVERVFSRELAMCIGTRVDILLRDIPEAGGNVRVVSDDTAELFFGPDV